MSLRSKLRKRFLKLVEDGGVREVERKIVTGEVDKTALVDVEKELSDAKAKIGAEADILEISDDDLREVIRNVARKCGLEVKNGS